jgi:Di-haem oxidoreductase, putative peroxidase
MNASHKRRRLVTLVLGSSFLAAAGGDAPIPWPGGYPPTSEDITLAIEDALSLAERDRFEEFLAAVNEFDDREHIFIVQNWIDDQQFTPADLFRFGDAFFNHEFRPIDGSGNDTLPSLRRVHTTIKGGFDTYSCSGCHSVGGADGAGSLTQNAFVNGDGEHLSSANVRNAPSVLGLGFVQMLAAEMSENLAALREKALLEASTQQKPITIDLVTKGVSFGTLTATPNGSLDFANVEGVDSDLVVKPFGWKGNVAKLRRFAEEAARIHFGVQSHVLALQWKDNPDYDKLGPGPDWWDPDNDGVQREIEEGALTAAAVYMALLEVPVMSPPYDSGLRERWGKGAMVFDEIGCNDCHRSRLLIKSGMFREYPDTTGGPPVEFNILAIGDEPRGSFDVQLFSDLKRHDMGPDLADPHDEPGSSIPRSVFLTRPLWGLAESAPYMHDGRATTIPDAIVAHGGEAQKARDAFVALDDDAKKDLHVYLLSLSRNSRLTVLP